MKFKEFDNPREKPQVRPVTNMDPKELGDRIEKAKAKAFKKPEPMDITKLWAKEKPATEEKVDYANIMFRGKEIDHNSIDYEMKDFGDMMFELHGAKYIDGTPLTDEELEEFEKTGELIDWVAEDYASSGPDAPDDYPYEEDGMTSADVDRIKTQYFTDKQIKQAYRVLNHPSVKGGNYTAAYNIINRIAPGLADHPDVANALKRANEGFIGKKMEYNDFLQNKLDQAIQEYDTPEKKAERDALMQKYLNKGGKVEKVPAGKTAYKGKELKPAYKKDNGTPITSPMSDESVQEGRGDHKKIMMQIQILWDMIDGANISDDAKESAVTSLQQIQQDISEMDEGVLEAELEEGLKDWAKNLAMAGIIVGSLAGVGSIDNAIDNSVPAVKALNTAYELAVDQGHTELANDIKKDLSAVKVRLHSGKDLNFVADIQNKYSKFVDAGGLPYSIDTEGLAYESKLTVLLNQRLK